MTPTKKRLGIFTAVIIFIAGVVLMNLLDSPSYTYHKHKLPASFDDYYREKLAMSAKLHVRPGNEERLVRYSPKKTPLAILYIHGYGASRAEGEYVVDIVAKTFKANTYYLRLPGHGTTKEDHRDTTMQQHLDAATEALLMMDRLGDKTVIVASSMGGLIATYLASQYPDKVAGLVLASPFYAFGAPGGSLMKYRPIFKIYVALNPIRDNMPKVLTTEDNWTRYWYPVQYFSAMQQLIDLAKFIARPAVYRKVTEPVLLLYYYDDEKKKDMTASVDAMREAFPQFGTGTKPNPLNRMTAIKRGNHVLLSRYEDVDWETSIKEITAFIGKLEITAPKKK